MISSGRILLVSALVGVLLGIGIFTMAALRADFRSRPPARDDARTAERGSLEGWVKKLDVEARVVHVSRGWLPFFPAAVAVDADTDIRVGSKIGSIGDLREGVRLRVCYEVRGDQRWARAVDVPPAPASCRSMIATERPRPRKATRSTTTAPAASVPTLPRETLQPARTSPPGDRSVAGGSPEGGSGPPVVIMPDPARPVSSPPAAPAAAARPEPPASTAPPSNGSLGPGTAAGNEAPSVGPGGAGRGDTTPVCGSGMRYSPAARVCVSGGGA